MSRRGPFGKTRKKHPRMPLRECISGGMSEEMLERLLGSAPDPLRSLLPAMRKDKRRSIGRLRPWAWWVEVTRGCNLRCWHCAVRLFPRGEFSFATMETWRQLMMIVREVSPVCRLEIGNAGEPTLNPLLPEMLAHARSECPNLQLMMYTNGTTLISGQIEYRTLFEAGLNVCLVDMYHPLERHAALAKRSGYPWCERYRRGPGQIDAFQHRHDPSFHAIVLGPNPSDWPERKVKRGAVSTFFNHLDWDAARKHGLEPVAEPPARRCDLPQKFPNVYWDGAYSFCCFDFAREVAGTLGNVSEGVDGFFRYWLGEYMQRCRLLLSRKDRAGHPMCSRCAFVSPRADIQWWPPELLTHFWDGSEWREVAP